MKRQVLQKNYQNAVNIYHIGHTHKLSVVVDVYKTVLYFNIVLLYFKHKVATISFLWNIQHKIMHKL